MSTVIGSSSGFPVPSDNFPIVADEIVEQDASWNLPDSTSDGNQQPSALQRIQALLRDHDLYASPDV